MEHPFINDLSDKTIEQLQDTISSLHQKLTFAYRTGNGPLIHQIKMVIESYRSEYQKKINEMIKKQNIEGQVRITKEG
jgi:hypothetical protein